MKEATENNMPELPRKIYQPPIIVALGEMLIGKGEDCINGGGAQPRCGGGSAEDYGTCTNGDGVISEY